jgi:hypothetical protein
MSAHKQTTGRSEPASESETSLLTDTDSDEGSSNNDQHDTMLEDPMYYMLENFLEAEDGKNIATILQELVIELKGIKQLLADKRQ